MKTLNLYPIDYPFETLVTKITSEQPTLILDPEFQRTYKWDKDGWERASKFIESCLMRIPLPACYFAESTGKKMLVIDGVQRLSTIQKFFNDEFELEGLTAFEELNGKRFSQLKEELQAELETTTIRCIVLRKENPKDLIQEIFSRLNQGSVELSPQEIRHAIYPGSLDRLLCELSELEQIKFFKVGISLSKEEKEKKKNSRESEEQVLRFFALQQDLSDYNDIFYKLLDEFASNNQNIDNSEINKLRNLFSSTLDKCLLVFGENAFKDTSKSKPRQSLVIYDLLMWSFANVNQEFIEKYKKEIRKKFDELCQSKDFQKVFSGGLQRKANIIKRRELWDKKLKEISK
ncbi:DUF262 domain-containing protein [Candidatus Halobeggiatoa sp. HSG11]|nr:DUF262 domain-containing protein [Candidatus Halobeggiatoa sp. HSG11]